MSKLQKKTTKKGKAAKKTPCKPKKKITDAEFAKLAKKLKIIIAEVLGVSEKRVTMRARFVEDLGMDSMMAVEILAAAERLYGIQVPDEAMTGIIDFETVLSLTGKLAGRECGKKS